MAVALIGVEAEPLVVRRCLEHHARLVHLVCPLGGPVYMHEVARGDWRHLERQPHVERFGFRCWEVWSNWSSRVLAIVVGDFQVVWADEEPDWPLQVGGRDAAGQALGGRPAGRRGWKPAYQDPRYHLVAPPKEQATTVEESAEPGSLDLLRQRAYPPIR